LEKAKRRLRTAIMSLNAGDYDSAEGLAYGVIELCMRALLVSKGVKKFPKTHGGLLKLFSEKLVKTKLFPTELMSKIGKVSSDRAVAEYDVVFISKNAAEEAIRTAEKVLEETIRIIRSLWPRDFQHDPPN